MIIDAQIKVSQCMSLTLTLKKTSDNKCQKLELPCLHEQ